MVRLADEPQVEACFGRFGDSVSVGQDRCTVCAKHTIGSEIILDAPNGTSRLRGSCGISFRSTLGQC
jgi:hypothetical protein